MALNIHHVETQQIRLCLLHECLERLSLGQNNWPIFYCTWLCNRFASMVSPSDTTHYSWPSQSQKVWCKGIWFQPRGGGRHSQAPSAAFKCFRQSGSEWNHWCPNMPRIFGFTLLEDDPPILNITVGLGTLKMCDTVLANGSNFKQKWEVDIGRRQNSFRSFRSFVSMGDQAHSNTVDLKETRQACWLTGVEVCSGMFWQGSCAQFTHFNLSRSWNAEWNHWCPNMPRNYFGWLASIHHSIGTLTRCIDTWLCNGFASFVLAWLRMTFGF